MEFKKFIEANGVRQEKGKNYKYSTKEKRFKMISKFIKESGKDIYQINEPKKIKKLLKSEKLFIKDLSDSHMKRGIEWYLTFLELKLIDFKSSDEVSDRSLAEGAKKKIYVNAYERSSKAREECIEHYGAICSVCNFDFEKVYGSLGKGYIHVHHLIALSEIKKEYKVNPIKDLRPVCPNCHAMLHQKKEVISIERLKEVLNNDTKKEG